MRLDVCEVFVETFMVRAEIGIFRNKFIYTPNIHKKEISVVFNFFPKIFANNSLWEEDWCEQVRNTPNGFCNA